jgi:hypothetical protein
LVSSWSLEVAKNQLSTRLPGLLTSSAHDRRLGRSFAQRTFDWARAGARSSGRGLAHVRLGAGWRTFVWAHDRRRAAIVRQLSVVLALSIFLQFSDKLM